MAEKRKFKKRYCKYCEQKVDFIDYKDLNSLKFSLSERFKIMPRRLTGNSKKAQEMVAKSIKRARHIALIPYIVDRKTVVTNPFDNKYINIVAIGRLRNEKGYDVLIKAFKKVVEEAGEFVFAIKDDDTDEIIYEGADLVYHCLVALASKDISPSRIK